MSRKKDFKQQDIGKALLWCGRHCCLCGKRCGAKIEVAHIDPKGPRTLDNAIPLCFDCHQEIGSYNPKHPRGRSYRPSELRERRDQIYEQHTANLVPPLHYSLAQNNRQLPDVGFTITHLGGPHWVKVRVLVTLAQGNRQFGPVVSPHYNGKYVWNLNPRFGVSAHFPLPDGMQWGSETAEPIRARIDIRVIDIYERAHDLLPVGYVLSLIPGQEWYLEPSEQALNVKRAHAFPTTA